MADSSIEISVRGKWIRVPALDVGGKTIFVKGRWIRMAAVHDEEWLATELEDPEGCVRKLKEKGSDGLHADIFTFAQKLPATQPKFNYPMNLESWAVAATTSFEQWWEKLPQETRKNVDRKSVV